MSVHWIVRQVGFICSKWRKERGFEVSAVNAALHICEEAGAVARIAIEMSQGIREHDREKLGDELADVIMAAAAMAEDQAVDLDQALRRRFGRLQTLNYDKRGNVEDGE